jgi:hypothetical protein
MLVIIHLQTAIITHTFNFTRTRIVYKAMIPMFCTDQQVYYIYSSGPVKFGSVKTASFFLTYHIPVH